MKRIGMHGVGMTPMRVGIAQLGAADWWDPDGEGLCVWAAYQPKGALSFAASLIDLSGNGNDAGDPGGAATPGWNTVNGWTFDGLADYLTTTFVPQNDQSQSVLVQYTNVTNAGDVCGCRTTVPAQFRIIPDSTGTVRYQNGAASVAVAPQLAAGNLGIAGNQGYRNGAADGGALAAWGGASTFALYIGARNRAGAADAFCAAYVTAIAIYDCVLTAGQMLNVATAMAAL